MSKKLEGKNIIYKKINFIEVIKAFKNHCSDLMRYINKSSLNLDDANRLK